LVKAEAECRGSSTELLDLAKGQSLKSLREETRRRRLGAIDPEELHALQHQAKTFRHWRTGLGMVGFTGELPPEIGVPIMNRLDAETDRLWQQARQAAGGRGEERRALVAADALVRLVGRPAARAERARPSPARRPAATAATTSRLTIGTRWPTAARRPSPT
jgi:hypothetical protein